MCILGSLSTAPSLQQLRIVSKVSSLIFGSLSVFVSVCFIRYGEPNKLPQNRQHSKQTWGHDQHSLQESPVVWIDFPFDFGLLMFSNGAVLVCVVDGIAISSTAVQSPRSMVDFVEDSKSFLVGKDVARTYMSLPCSTVSDTVSIGADGKTVAATHVSLLCSNVSVVVAIGAVGKAVAWTGVSLPCSNVSVVDNVVTVVVGKTVAATYVLLPCSDVSVVVVVVVVIVVTFVTFVTVGIVVVIVCVVVGVCCRL